MSKRGVSRDTAHNKGATAGRSRFVGTLYTKNSSTTMLLEYPPKVISHGAMRFEVFASHVLTDSQRQVADDADRLQTFPALVTSDPRKRWSTSFNSASSFRCHLSASRVIRARAIFPWLVISTSGDFAWSGLGLPFVGFTAAAVKRNLKVAIFSKHLQFLVPLLFVIEASGITGFQVRSKAAAALGAVKFAVNPRNT